MFLLFNVALLTIKKQLNNRSVSYLLTGAAWNFSGRKRNNLYLHINHTYMTTHRSYYLLKIRYQFATVKFENIELLH